LSLESPEPSSDIRLGENQPAALPMPGPSELGESGQ
jgi:hypothetical protein